MSWVTVGKLFSRNILLKQMLGQIYFTLTQKRRRGPADRTHEVGALSLGCMYHTYSSTASPRTCCRWWVGLMACNKTYAPLYNGKTALDSLAWVCETEPQLWRPHFDGGNVQKYWDMWKNPMWSKLSQSSLLHSLLMSTCSFRTFRYQTYGTILWRLVD